MNVKNVVKKNNFKASFAILRMYLSFVVVNLHLFNTKTSKIKNKYIIRILKNSLSVPLFYLMSFYFSSKIFIKIERNKLILRFERLLIPYFIWPIIILLINRIFNIAYKLNLKDSLNDIKLQFLLGHNFMPVLWFQINLIFVTFLIIILRKIFYKNLIYILLNLEIFSYFIQYSNLNFKLFSNFHFCIRYPIGRFIEIIPYCISGYIFGYLNCEIFLEKNKIKVVSFFLFFYALVIKYDMFIIPKGFGYQGINLNVLSIIIFIIISSISFENKIIIRYIKIYAQFSSGIYYLHNPIWTYFSCFFGFIKNKTFYGSITIYFICYLISFIGLKIFGKTKLRNLFI